MRVLLLRGQRSDRPPCPGLHLPMDPPPPFRPSTRPRDSRRMSPHHLRRTSKTAPRATKARERCGESCTMGPTHCIDAWPFPPHRVMRSRWLNTSAECAFPVRVVFGPSGVTSKMVVHSATKGRDKPHDAVGVVPRGTVKRKAASVRRKCAGSRAVDRRGK